MNTPPLLLGAALLFWGWQAGFLWLGIMIALTLSDYLSRDSLHIPGK